MSKFKALKEILEGVAPAVAREGEEAAASALAKEAEEAAAREAYKAEFDANPIIYHGSGHNNIEEFIPSEDGALGGPGIYATTNPNIANVYADGAWGSDPKFAPKIRIPTIYPLKYRGRTFNDTNVQDWLDLMKALNIPYSHSDIPSKGSLAAYPSVREKLVKLKGLTNALRESDLFTAQKYQDMIMVLDPKNVRSIFAKFDPKKRNSGNIADSIVAATTGAGAYSALSPESAEASEIKEKPKSQLKDLLNQYSPSFGSKTGDYSSYDESEALPTEGMQGQGLATIIRNIIADKKPKGEFEEGGGGIEESAISPIDLVTPGMVTTPAKALGRGALTAGKAGLEAVESGAQALAKRYPELAKRLADNRGSIDLSKKASEYMVPGPWQTGTYRRFTEELPIEFLKKYKGNALGKTDIEALKKSIQEEGLREPLILSFDPKNNKIKLGEGNHRLEALRQLGYTHAPVRAYRSYIDDVQERLLGPSYAEFPSIPFKPSNDPIDPLVFYPADSKPSDIIDFEKLLKSKK